MSFCQTLPLEKQNEKGLEVVTDIFLFLVLFVRSSGPAYRVRHFSFIRLYSILLINQIIIQYNYI